MRFVVTRVFNIFSVSDCFSVVLASANAKDVTNEKPVCESASAALFAVALTFRLESVNIDPSMTINQRLGLKSTPALYDRRCCPSIEFRSSTHSVSRNVCGVLFRHLKNAICSV
jgi:hypothetical protein